MNREAENLSKADLANASSQSPADPGERSNAETSVRARQPVKSEPGRRQPRVEEELADVEEEPVDTEAEAVPIEAEALPIDAVEDDAAGVREADVVTGPLFDPYVARDLQARWNEIQVAFVDEPRAAVERADNLVAETTKCLEDSFAAGRRKLESEWDRGGDLSTESLRLAIQRYRSFFNRLLAL
jgi:hypothetical protein